jgi:hypothetical protein
LIGADVFDHVALRRAGRGQRDPVQEPADRAVPDRDVLAVGGVDAASRRTEAGGEATELEPVEVQDHVVRLDVDGVTQCDARRQVPGEQ